MSWPESDFEPEKGDPFTMSGRLGSNDRSWTDKIWMCTGATDTHVRAQTIGDSYTYDKVFPKHQYHFYPADELV